MTVFDFSTMEPPYLLATPDTWEELKERFAPSTKTLLGDFSGIPVYIVEDLDVPWKLVPRTEPYPDLSAILGMIERMMKKENEW